MAAPLAPAAHTSDAPSGQPPVRVVARRRAADVRTAARIPEGEGSVKRGRTERETCDLNGWKVGTRLVGDGEVIRITAIGEESILAVDDDGENLWTLADREWREVTK